MVVVHTYLHLKCTLSCVSSHMIRGISPGNEAINLSRCMERARYYYIPTESQIIVSISANINSYYRDTYFLPDQRIGEDSEPGGKQVEYCYILPKCKGKIVLPTEELDILHTFCKWIAGMSFISKHKSIPDEDTHNLN
jgi:hypothetical protein